MLAPVGLARHVQLSVVRELTDAADQVGVGLSKPLGRGGWGDMTLRRRVRVAHIGTSEGVVGVDVLEQSDVASDLARRAFRSLRQRVPGLIAY